MKQRVAKKVLENAINGGRPARHSTLRRAVNALPRGPRQHPRKYWAAGLIAAFLRLGISIDELRFGLQGAIFDKRLGLDTRSAE